MLTDEQTIIACKNIGYDLTCGACAERFYTGGSWGSKHDASCTTVSALRSSSTVTITTASRKLDLVGELRTAACVLPEESTHRDLLERAVVAVATLREVEWYVGKYLVTPMGIPLVAAEEIKKIISGAFGKKDAVT